MKVKMEVADETALGDGPRRAYERSPVTDGDGTERLGALWNYLSSWVAPDGGIHGPVVHRGDLKRMFAIHDTAWTQQAVIEGLLFLYRRSGNDYWLRWALRLADAQCARQDGDGRFRWAGHEDDRYSSLVHNTLADCALLDTVAVLQEQGDAQRRNRYLAVVEKNLDDYVIGQLYRPALGGFAMNPIDYYAGRDRFIVNMNSVSVEALIKLDRQRGTTRYARLVHSIGERIRSLQARDGLCQGSFAYSHIEPDVHVSLYTAIAVRGILGFAELTNAAVWSDIARGVIAFLLRVEDAETGLWYHKVEHDQLCRFPLFVAGAGMICNGIFDAAQLTGTKLDAQSLAARLLRYQHRNGAIRNFIGYDHPDNGRRRGVGTDCWEDIYPTPSWNAQAFHFLCRVLPPPEPPLPPRRSRTLVRSRRYLYLETRRYSAIVGVRPLDRGIMAVYLKGLRHGLVAPGRHMIVRAAVKMLMNLRSGRAALRWLRRWMSRRSTSLASE
ncbi:hypothetical protein [Candidatus Methylomirabilis sp.]|uniref:hypothetical protein n=1 Tax=Candidatus Methylomirabilis sp. TaxID=2032687 RepID=UPI00307607D8